jgi:fructose-1,6-bisphosphatase/inositol monophosphatase family enzyme
VIDVAAAGRVAAILAEAARTEIMPRWRNLADGAVRTKSGPLDLVTDADEAAERVITAELRAMFPGCLVVGEEAAEADRTLLGRLAGADLGFVVDPVDGTANFAAGMPLFGTMCAAIVRGRTVAGWIHDPFAGDTAVAIAGHGAWADVVGGARTALRVARGTEPARMAGAASWRYFPEPLRSTVAANLTATAGAWDYRCAAHEYRMTAAGHAHFLLFNRLMPWDHAAGVLLLTEAGGHCAHLDGTPYAPTRFDGGLLCAPDEVAWHALHATLFAGLDVLASARPSAAAVL